MKKSEKTILDKTKQILVVEDSEALRKLLAIRLEKLGVSVVTASDGFEAIEIAKETPIDMILSDVDMPKMTGLELCKNIKNDPELRGIPVIILSGLDTDMDIDKGFEAGASAYIPKAVSDELLTKTIVEVMDKIAFQMERTIMVVDDSVTILRLVEVGLSKNGFQVITALNGKEALRLLKKKKPDVIISDLDMPVMSGFELCEEVRRDKSLSTIPFMVMSANSERSTMRGMIERGAAAFMVKPFNMEQLIITVEKLLSEQFQLILHERERLELEKISMLATITSLVQALEARDSYTRGHSERVSEISLGIGTVLGIDQEEMEAIRLGGRLHDIGKIGVPDGLLLKKGKLTDEEIAIFRKHPVIGTEILEPIHSLASILPLVRHHHEHFNGKGYPEGLKGEEIPLTARITAVADCYDALTTNRPYRDGFDQERAFQIIKEVRGTQLCGDCVDAFFEWIDS
ncbi:MAG: response regulator [Deltaproteobacteria bacterium]|nr:response regulator [Deltaproteobacteria bacterium]